MMNRIPPVVKNILIINVIFFLATMFFKQTMRFDLSEYLGLYFYKSANFQPYQYISYLFMHGDMMHIFFNMFAFWMFGRILEQVWGSKKFLIYFFVTGIGAAVLHTFVNWVQYIRIEDAVDIFMKARTPQAFDTFVQGYFPEFYDQIYNKLLTDWVKEPNNPMMLQKAIDMKNQLVMLHVNIPTVGASGAVFGVLLAFGMMFPNMELMLLFPPMPIKAKYMVAGYALIELYSGVLNQQGDNVAHFAHLGGMLFGFFLVRHWKKTSNRNFYY
jgi:membrane associated rhomboid family serine protease